MFCEEESLGKRIVLSAFFKKINHTKAWNYILILSKLIRILFILLIAASPLSKLELQCVREAQLSISSALARCCRYPSSLSVSPQLLGELEMQ